MYRNMKSINLYSLYKISDQYDIISCNKMIRFLQKYDHSNLKEQELEGFDKFIKMILDKTHKFEYLSNFFVGYNINQISKEFDLLRISEKLVLNIEFKSESKLDKMKKQLKHNKFYLNVLQKEMILVSFNTKLEKLYRLQDDTLVEIDIDYIIRVLGTMESFDVDIDYLFKPSNFLISPLNSPELFLDRAYFLTDLQVNISKEIKDKIEISNNRFLIEGEPGTGKTLLAFDLGIYYSKKIKVCIIHCGKLSKGHKHINDYSDVDIYPIKKISKINIINYDLIIIDEAQRIFPKEWEYIESNILILDILMVFCLDPIQVMSQREVLSNSTSKIKKIPNIQNYKLTKSIRSNPTIVDFVKAIMNTGKREKIKDTNSLHLYSSRNTAQTINLINILKDTGFKYIKYTPSNYNKGHMDIMPDSVTSHDVIGQEFNDVVIVINDDFYYENKILKSKIHPNPNLLYDRLLYQSATRARNNLAIIVENNIEVFNTLLNLLVMI